MRNMLSDFTGEAPSFFSISVTDKGKPYQENYPGIYFSISHSYDYVAVVISDSEVGIDIEKIRPYSLTLTKRVCNTDEAEYVFGFPPQKDDFYAPPSSEQLIRFLKIWTAKEAYFKCIGTGITDFKSVNFLKPSFSKRLFSENDYIMHIVTM